MSTAPSASPRDPGRKGLIATAWILVALILAVAVAIVFAIRGDLRLPGAAADNAILLEAADELGANPFSDKPLASAPDPAIATPLTTAAPPATVTPAVQTGGGTPGLYGGSNDLGTCNVAQLKSFLASNPDKAAAWVGAFNADPTLRWAGGELTVADIPAYIDSLTPIVLVSDTMATNHGYENGVATPLQSVLQRGTAVLVDSYGVPRVKCFCGNPLLAPKTPAQPTFEGTPWEGFDPSTVVVVVPNGTPMTEFELRIPATPDGQLVTVVVGCSSTGTCTTEQPTATPAPTETATPTAPPATTQPEQPFYPPDGQYCAGAFAGDPEVENFVVNELDVWLAVFYYDQDCHAQHTGWFAPGESGSVYSDLPSTVFVVTADSADIVSAHELQAGATWTIK